MKRYRELSNEEEQALMRFAKAHGRTWKRALLHQWMQARADPVLHALRNSHGPNWLVRYPLPTQQRDLPWP